MREKLKNRTRVPLEIRQRRYVLRRELYWSHEYSINFIRGPLAG